MKNHFGKQKSNHSRDGREFMLEGRAVSRGIGIGKVLCFYGRKRQFYRSILAKNKINYEVKRFFASVRLAKRQLKKVSRRENKSIGKNQASIFETHLLFLEDKLLLAKIENTIREEKVNAEWAVKIVVDSCVSKYKLLSDKNLREKYIDLEDIAERLLTALGGEKKVNVNIEKDTVIVAKELNPSTLIEINKGKPKAIITENGGWTSHTFILARELRLPAITGLRGILRIVNAGEEIIVNGFTGCVTLRPQAKTKRDSKKAKREFENSIGKECEFINENPRTLDGVEVIIRANLDVLNAYEHAGRFGAKGVGLYRSEFLFNQNRGFPTEKEQIKSYAKIGDMVGEDGVRIRTFDLSVSQIAGRTDEKEKNPALGLRAIRFGLADEIQFRKQLRSLLIASFNRHIDIVLPMVSDISEILQAKIILQEEKQLLKKQGIEFGRPKLGVMIEVPASILIIDKIVEEVDFVSLGTNDLIQYLLAVDRDNEDVANWFRTLHPAVLSSLRKVIRTADKGGIPSFVCGEMAGSPIYAAILIGLGASELSISLNSIARIRKVIAGIAYEEAKAMVDSLEVCKTAYDVEENVRKAFSEKWRHLVDDETLMPKHSVDNFKKAL